MSRQGEEKTKCPALPKHNGKTKPPRSAGSAHRPRTCLLDNRKKLCKLCTSKWVQTGNCGNTRTCMVPSVHVRCRFANAFKTCFLACAQRIFELTLHLTGHFTTLYFTRCRSVCIDNRCPTSQEIQTLLTGCSEYPGRFYPFEPGAAEELAAVGETRVHVGFDFATVLSSCSFHLLTLNKRSITCEVALCQHVCKLIFCGIVFHLHLWVQVDSVK